MGRRLDQARQQREALRNKLEAEKVLNNSAIAEAYAEHIRDLMAPFFAPVEEVAVDQV